MGFSTIRSTWILAGALMLAAGCSPAPPAADSLKTSAPPEATAELYTPDRATAGPVTTRPYDPTAVATIGNVSISRSDLDDSLRQAYGLRFVFDLAVEKLAEDMLANNKMALLPQDIERERKIVLDKICGDATPDQRGNLFEQFLTQQHTTRTEFEVKIVKTNAAVRKIVEPKVIDKLPEELLVKGYEQLYGGNRRIADITLPDLRAVEDAKGRLRNGVPFKDVAQLVSIDPYTRPLGGAWQPFSNNSPRVPPAIRDAAFSLKVGEISDAIAVEDQFRNTRYHMIQVLEDIPPKTATFASVRGDVKRLLEEEIIQKQIALVRDELGKQAQLQVRLADGELQKQWNASAAKPNGTLNKDDVDHRIDQDHDAGPTTAPVAKAGDEKK